MLEVLLGKHGAALLLGLFIGTGFGILLVEGVKKVARFLYVPDHGRTRGRW